MNKVQRSLLLGFILLVTGASSIAQTSGTNAPAPRTGDQSTADRAAAAKAAADKAAADKAAADKAAADKVAADKTAAASNPLSLNNGDIYQKSLAALTMAFVIAVLLENAFAVIFSWRVFLTYFSLKGVKTIIMVAVAWLIVQAFGVDVMASLIAAYKSPPSGVPIDPAQISGFASKFITALTLAGGSAGVNKIMVALGFRTNSSEENTPPQPPRDKAWVSVTVIRVRAVSVAVMIEDKGAPVAGSPSPIAGAVQFKRPELGGLIFTAKNRFPPNGGYTLSPNIVYSIKAEATDANGTVFCGNTVHGEDYVFAPGAIVDFVIKL